MWISKFGKLKFKKVGAIHREKKIEVQTQIFLFWAGQTGQIFLAGCFGQSKVITDGSTCVWKSNSKIFFEYQ